MGMGELLGEGQRLLAPLEGLRWIAQDPETRASKTQARHPGVDAIEEGLGALLLGSKRAIPCSKCVLAARKSPRQSRVLPSAHALPGGTSVGAGCASRRVLPPTPVLSAAPPGCDRTSA